LLFLQNGKGLDLDGTDFCRPFVAEFPGYRRTPQPSWSWTIRDPYSAFFSECMTWMIAVPPLFSFLNNSVISLPRLEGRLP